MTIFQQLRNEKGVALVAAVGTILILIVIVFGLMAYGQNSLAKIIEHKKYIKALNLGDSGVEHVTWLFKNQSLPDSYYDNITTLDFGDKGICRFKVYQGSLGFEKRVISVGVLPDGTKKAIEVTLFSINIWDLLLSAGEDKSDRRPGGSGGIQGNGLVRGPLYIRGNLPILLGTFDIYEGPLFVKDGSIIKGSASGYIGTSVERVSAFVTGTDAGAIFKKQGSSFIPLTTQEEWETVNIYLSRLSRNVPDIEFPALTNSVLQEMYDKAKQEGSDNILPSYPESGTKYSFIEGNLVAQISAVIGVPGMTNYKVIDNNGTLDRSLKTAGITITIGGSTSFGLVDANGDGLVSSLDTNYYEFAYDGTSKKLYIRGTIFIDGDVVIDPNIMYEGRGTLVVNGSIRINNKLLASSDFPQTNAIGLVVKDNLNVYTSSANDEVDDLQVAVYTEGDVSFYSNNTRFYGAMIAGFIDMASANNIQLILAEALPGNLPPSLPASDSNIVSITGWREIAVPSGF